MSAFAEGGWRGAILIYRRDNDIIHPLYCNARKLRWVARSSSTVELLAASDAASNLVYLQEVLTEISYRPKAEMLIDSRYLLNLVTSIREPTEPANKIDLAAMRESFTPQTISAYGWVPSHYNIADGLTKFNKETGSLLLKVLREGIYSRHPNTYMLTAEPSLTMVIDEDDQLKNLEHESSQGGDV